VTTGQLPGNVRERVRNQAEKNRCSARGHEHAGEWHDEGIGNGRHQSNAMEVEGHRQRQGELHEKGNDEQFKYSVEHPEWDGEDRA
jgi:hypothetical protein